MGKARTREWKCISISVREQICNCGFLSRGFLRNHARLEENLAKFLRRTQPLVGPEFWAVKRRLHRESQAYKIRCSGAIHPFSSPYVRHPSETRKKSVDLLIDDARHARVKLPKEAGFPEMLPVKRCPVKTQGLMLAPDFDYDDDP